MLNSSAGSITRQLIKAVCFRGGVQLCGRTNTWHGALGSISSTKTKPSLCERGAEWRMKDEGLHGLLQMPAVGIRGVAACSIPTAVTRHMGIRK